jgi:hypothetical protein
VPFVFTQFFKILDFDEGVFALRKFDFSEGVAETDFSV